MRYIHITWYIICIIAGSAWLFAHDHADLSVENGETIESQLVTYFCQLSEEAYDTSDDVICNEYIQDHFDEAWFTYVVRCMLQKQIEHDMDMENPLLYTYYYTLQQALQETSIVCDYTDQSASFAYVEPEITVYVYIYNLCCAEHGCIPFTLHHELSHVRQMLNVKALDTWKTSLGFEDVDTVLCNADKARQWHKLAQKELGYVEYLMQAYPNSEYPDFVERQVCAETPNDVGEFVDAVASYTSACPVEEDSHVWNAAEIQRLKEIDAEVQAMCFVPQEICATYMLNEHNEMPVFGLRDKLSHGYIAYSIVALAWVFGMDISGLS